MNIRMIALDLDGTLVGTNGAISRANTRALAAAAEAGIRIVIATGRIQGDAMSFRLLAGTNSPAVACNGAVIINGDFRKPLYARHLGLEKSLEVINAMHSCGSACHLYTGNSVYIERGSPGAVWYRNRLGELPPDLRFELNFVDDLGAWISSLENPPLPHKIMTVEHDPERRNALDRILPAITGIEITGSHHTNREVLPEGVTKGTALAVVAEGFGLTREEVMAIGDNDNDLSMFAFAGLSVAMGNAPDHVRRAAKAVTGTNDEDGVAAAISRIMNGKL